MVESSDESPVWTSASSDNESSLPEVKSDHSEGDSECKKKLQDKLFKHENEIVDEKPRKKRKVKEEPSEKGYQSVQVKEEETARPSQPELQNGFLSKAFVSDDSSDESSKHSEPSQRHKSKKSRDKESEEESISSNPINDTLPEKASQRKSKISERIQFEDEMLEVNGETNGVHLENGKNEPTRIKRYLKANPNLRPISTRIDNDAAISDDDEIWLVRCPYSVNIDDLMHCSFTVESKSKFKHNGQTYEGSMSNENRQVTLLNSGPLLKNYKQSGAVWFRKKVPKAHYMEDNTIENCQTNFIPLPDTKLRHPLFGVNYKKSIKIRSSVKARLKNSEIESSTVCSEKKKSKRKRQAESLAESDPTEAAPSHSPSRSPARKRRRHGSPAPARGWDSEQAIEQNLFNF